MSKLLNLAQELESLVDRYGVSEVQHTLNFIKEFPGRDSIVLRDVTGNVSVRVSYSQYSDMYLMRQAGRKIEAIKYLRDITGIGLKESKDTVENDIAWHNNPSTL